MRWMKLACLCFLSVFAASLSSLDRWAVVGANNKEEATRISCVITTGGSVLFEGGCAVRVFLGGGTSERDAIEWAEIAPGGNRTRFLTIKNVGEEPLKIEWLADGLEPEWNLTAKRYLTAEQAAYQHGNIIRGSKEVPPINQWIEWLDGDKGRYEVVWLQPKSAMNVAFTLTNLKAKPGNYTFSLMITGV